MKTQTREFGKKKTQKARTKLEFGRQFWASANSLSGDHPKLKADQNYRLID